MPCHRIRQRDQHGQLVPELCQLTHWCMSERRVWLLYPNRRIIETSHGLELFSLNGTLLSIHFIDHIHAVLEETTFYEHFHLLICAGSQTALHSPNDDITTSPFP